MDDPSNTPPLEVWTGIECTVNRVGDRYFDQLQRSGHDWRVDDLDRIVSLGVRRIRYPVLWERVAPNSLNPSDIDWTWTDLRLGRLRDAGVAPIAGLIHHGSGPRYTNLLDENFAELLASYAGLVVRRYPWISMYTPVNEPLTTARFSCLYGHWYPHGTSDLLFARALLNQCKATVLAMRAIREVNPAAQLISTEDLGFTRSSPLLTYQAEFENQRRWVSIDLLSGLIDSDHPLHPWLRSVGIPESALDWFLDNPCPPDVIGCNYYVTSERYLDEDFAKWPAHEQGGNGRHRYADVAAARVCGLAGAAELAIACFARFGSPIAITEAHLGCTRDDQLRWLLYMHDQVEIARRVGVPVVALTAWSMLGSFDWASLVTRQDGHYEPGLFDVRGEEPRPTALATMVRDFARGRTPTHPVLGGRGWWQRSTANDREVM